MGSEIAEGANLLLVLVLISMVMAIVITVMSVIRLKASEEVTKFQNGVSTLSESDFDEYNQKPRTGTDILTAVNKYDGLDIGIVVETIKSGKSNKAYNLNALLKGASDGNYEVSTSNFDDNNGADPYYISSYAGSDGDPIVRNTNTAAIEKNGGTYYVRPTAKFDAKIIRNESEDIIGIYFKQQKRN